MTTLSVTHQGMCGASTKLNAGADTITTSKKTTSQRGTRRAGKRLFAFAAALALAAATLTTVAPVAEAATVTTTGQVTLRTGPGTNYASKGTLNKGTSITITCYTTGTSINGNPYWDKLSNGYYVSDYYVNLGGKYPSQAGYKDCSFASAVASAVAAIVAAAPSVPTTATTTDNVNARFGPGTSYAITATYRKGASIAISCYTTGTSINGDPYWDKLSNGTYVSDYYVNLGGKYPYQVGIKRC